MTQTLAASVATADAADTFSPIDPLHGMSGFRKAAVLVLQLGRVESSRVLGVLSDKELEELTAEIARMGEVSAEVSAAVLAEFAFMMMAGPGAARPSS
jgi:flagellar motor switch protein FliG